MHKPDILTKKQINALCHAQSQKESRETVKEMSCVEDPNSFLIRKVQYERNMTGSNRGYTNHLYTLQIYK